MQQQPPLRLPSSGHIITLGLSASAKDSHTRTVGRNGSVSTTYLFRRSTIPSLATSFHKQFRHHHVHNQVHNCCTSTGRSRGLCDAGRYISREHIAAAHVARRLFQVGYRRERVQSSQTYRVRKWKGIASWRGCCCRWGAGASSSCDIGCVDGCFYSYICIFSANRHSVNRQVCLLSRARRDLDIWTLAPRWNHVTGRV